VGVLDDAIREHLELKRRHGAGEDELRRQEVEALGPARREPVAREQEQPAEGALGHEEDRFAEVEAAPLEPAPGPEPPFDQEPAGERVADEVPAEESLDAATLDPSAPPLDVGVDREARALDEEELAEEELAAELAGDESVVEEAEPAEDLPPEELAEDLPPEEPAEDLPPEESADPDQADEDVLEETPEFLQETPEHERLWFEQKPPRDFDLDR
jgi:hypothetical protein